MTFALAMLALAAQPGGNVVRDVASDAAEINRRAPVRMADGIVTGAEARGRDLVVLVTLDGLLGPHDDVDRIERAKAREVCEGPSIRALIERGARITYRATAPDGAVRELRIASCDVPPDPSLVSGTITMADYPLPAIRAEAQGTVGVRLLVGRDGAVGDCRVAQTSGNADLDAATCQLVQQRFRFAPLPTPTGTLLRITWRLPDE